MRTGNPVHDVGASHRDTQRHSRRNAFCHADHVRLDSSMFRSPPLAGASHTALHFVDYEQNAMTIADAPKLLHKIRRTYDISSFTFNRLNIDFDPFYGIQRPLQQLLFITMRTSYR